MLDSMRKGARDSVTLKVIFGAIVVVFVFWGVGTLGFNQMEVVARINDEIITTTAYERAYRNLAEVYRDAPANLFPEALLREQTLDQMINTELLVQEASRLGLQVDGEELRESIVAVPAFQNQGRFDKDLYLRVLAANGLKAADFEDTQRRQLLATKLQEVVVGGVHVSEQETRARYGWENGRVRLRVVRISASGFADAIVISDEDLQTYYEEKKESFREPERVKIRYLSFRPDFFRGQIEPSEESILAYYQEHSEEYRRPEEVRARQIVVAKPAGASDGQLVTLRTRAEGIAEAAKSAESFEALAANDADVSTNDLGLFGRGVMQTPIEEAVFALEAGGVSGVVETDSGFYVLKVEEKRPERTDPLDEVRESVVDAIRSAEARRFTLDRVEAAHEKVLGGATLEDVAKENGLEIEGPSPFGRGESVGKLGPAPELRDAAFAAAAGQTGEIVTLDSGYVLFQVDERLPSQVPAIDAIRDQVEAALRQERSAEAAIKRAEELLARLKESTDLDALATAEGLTVEDSEPVGRQGDAFPGLGVVPELKAAAFALTPAAPVAPAVYRAGPDALIAVLAEQVPADEAGFEGAREALANRWKLQLQTTTMKQFLVELKGKATIEFGPGYGTNGSVS